MKKLVRVFCGMLAITAMASCTKSQEAPAPKAEDHRPEQSQELPLDFEKTRQVPAADIAASQKARSPGSTAIDRGSLSDPKPPTAAYTHDVQAMTLRAQYEAAGKGVPDEFVALMFPICVQTNGSMNQEYIKRFKEILEAQAKWNLKHRIQNTNSDPHRNFAEVEPMDMGDNLQYQIMMKESRVIPPKPSAFEYSETFVQVMGSTEFVGRDIPLVHHFIAFAQMEYLANATPDAALATIRRLRRGITDAQAAFLLRNSIDELMRVTEYTVYQLPPKR